MSPKNREKISSDLAAKVLFMSDRTCCVCNEQKKPVQIHHIDENPANNNFENLAVLCFDCHTETQIRGGFHRKLDGDQVSLYRDHWLIQVAKSRATDPAHYVENESKIYKLSVEVATSVAEIYRENQEYQLLALHYCIYENNELRDKYIELAIEKGMENEDLIFYRHIQGKIHLVPKEVITNRIHELTEDHDYSELARLYRVIGDPINSVKSSCRFVLNKLDNDNLFSPAFYLNEMFKEGDVRDLFLMSFEKSKSENDLWWQYRVLQELDWFSEQKRFLLENKQRIIKENKLPLLEALALAEGDIEKYFELQKEMAQKDCE